MNNLDKRFKLIRISVAISSALILALLIILLTSSNPFQTMYDFLIGPLTTARRMGNVIELMIPLLFTGVGVSIMFSAGQVNLSSEGAFFLGGVAAAYVAVSFLLPLGIHPFAAIAAGGAVGAIVGVIPALLYLKFNALPVVSSLMINFVCMFLGLYVINYLIIDPQAGFLASLEYPKSSLLPRLFPVTRIHFGLFIAILVLVLGYLFLMKSKWGYSIRMIGKNANFAKYSGIRVAYYILLSQLLGGAIAGMGGAIEQLGIYNRFQYQRLSGHGFDGILVAILAGYNPKLIPLATFFLAYIRTGADIMSRTSDVPIELIFIIQSVIIVFVAAERFLEGWKHKAIVKRSKEALVTEEV